jgi:hypothetical protein
VCPGGNCQTTCVPGSTCNVACNGGNCKTQCAAGAKCQVTCPGGGCQDLGPGTAAPKPGGLKKPGAK